MSSVEKIEDIPIVPIPNKIKKSTTMNSQKYNNKNKLLEELNKEVQHLTSANHTEQALRFIELLHSQNTGLFTMCQKDKKTNKFSTIYFGIDKDEPNKFKHKPEYNDVMRYLNLKDVYLSLNSFFIPKREAKNVRNINCFYIDLDFYKTEDYFNRSVDGMIKIMRRDGMFDDLEPSFFVDSGKGMYIYYLLEDNLPSFALKNWNRIEAGLIDRFKEYGADPQAKDVSRILRLPGSINSKTNKRAKIIINTETEKINRYKLREIADFILGPLPFKKEEWLIEKEKRLKQKREYQKEKKVKEKRKAKITRLFNLYSLNKTRYEDIETLIKIRNYDIEGTRAITFHLYFTFKFFTTDSAEEFDDVILNVAKNINKQLKKPLPDRELTSIYKSAHALHKKYINFINKKENRDVFIPISVLRSRGFYLYTNKTVIEKLNITQNEMQHMKILINSIEKERRKRAFYEEHREEINLKRREKYSSHKRKEAYKEEVKKNNKLTREEKNTILRKKIRSLLDKDFKKNEIAKKLDVSVRTIERHIKILNENT